MDTDTELPVDDPVTVTITMPRLLHDELKVFSHARGVSVTEMMRQAVGAYVRAS